MPLSKNRSPERIFLPRDWAGLASCLYTQHQKTPPSTFTLFHVSSQSWVLPPEASSQRRKCPAQPSAPKAPGNTGGLSSQSPLAALGCGGGNAYFELLGWPGSSPQTFHPRQHTANQAPRGRCWGRTSSRGWSRQPELPERPLRSRWDNPDTSEICMGSGGPPECPVPICYAAHITLCMLLTLSYLHLVQHHHHLSLLRILGTGPVAFPPSGCLAAHVVRSQFSLSAVTHSAFLSPCLPEPSSWSLPLQRDLPFLQPDPSWLSQHPYGRGFRGHLLPPREGSIPGEALGLRFNFSSHHSCALKVLR